MDPEKRKRLEARGWSVGTVGELLGMPDEEYEAIKREVEAALLFMRRFHFSVYWSEEDESFIATVAEQPYLSTFGDSPADAIREMQVVLKAIAEDL